MFDWADCDGVVSGAVSHHGFNFYCVAFCWWGVRCYWFSDVDYHGAVSPCVCFAGFGFVIFVSILSLWCGAVNVAAAFVATVNVVEVTC